MAANIAVFLSYVAGLQDARIMNELYGTWAMIPAEITAGQSFETVLTSMFLHAGWMHLAGNMLFLFIFGDNMEDEMGHLPYLAFYLASGVAAALIQVGSEPLSNIPTVGASGAIAGVMGGYMLLFPKARVDIFIFLLIIIRIIPIPAWVMLAIWFAMQFIGGLGAPAGEGGVAYWAHAGGFVAGLILTIPLWLKLGGTRFWVRTHGHPPHPEATYTSSRLPKVRRK